MLFTQQQFWSLLQQYLFAQKSTETFHLPILFFNLVDNEIEWPDTFLVLWIGKNFYAVRVQSQRDNLTAFFNKGRDSFHECFVSTSVGVVAYHTVFPVVCSIPEPDCFSYRRLSAVVACHYYFNITVSVYVYAEIFVDTLLHLLRHVESDCEKGLARTCRLEVLNRCKIYQYLIT